MKIKIIDLLNKIANGEEIPHEIEYCNKKYRYDSLSTDYEQIGGFNSLFKDLLILKYCSDLPKCLNDEIEIIEEPKKIEKIARCDSFKVNGELYKPTENQEILRIKINELIDEINNLKEE